MSCKYNYCYRKVREQNSFAYKQLGLNRAKYLARGSYGIIFRVGKKVVKLTCEREDAKAAHLLVGNKVKHVVRIHNVFQITDGFDPVYAIIQENLSYNPPFIGRIVGQMGEILEERPILKRNPLKLTETYFKVFGDNMDNPQKVPYVANALSTAFSGLSNLGITSYTDLHPNNAMRDGRGSLKLIDFGLTRTKGAYSPTLLGL